MEKEALRRRPKKIDESLKPTALNQRQLHGRRSLKSKTSPKNGWKPKAEGLKPQAVTWKKKPWVDEQKKIEESLKPMALNQGQ